MIMQVSAILTAAGESTRMGRLKALLPWGGLTLVEHQVKCLLDAGVSEVVVVLGHRADDIAPYINGQNVCYTLNPDYKQGKTTSIRAGLRAISPDAEAILLLAVDQPRTADVIAQVLHDHIEKNAVITSPRYQGHGGHPLIFSAALKSELKRITEENQGIREVFQAHRDEVNEVAIDNPILRLDLNTPESYEEAMRAFGCD